MYISIEEFVNQFGYARTAKYASSIGGSGVQPKVLEALIRGSSTTGIPPNQIKDAQDGVKRIESAISAGESIINSYLCNRYPIPLPSVILNGNKNTLRTLAGNISRYMLTPSKNVVAITDKYNEAISYLNRASNFGLNFYADDGTSGKEDSMYKIASVPSSFKWERY